MLSILQKVSFNRLDEVYDTDDYIHAVLNSLSLLHQKERE